MISALALADVIVLARKNVFGIALVSVFCLGLSLALFSAIPSVQLSPEYENGLDSAGFPLPWYSATDANLIACQSYCYLLPRFQGSSDPIHFDNLLFDSVVYSFLVVMLIQIGTVTKRLGTIKSLRRALNPVDTL